VRNSIIAALLLSVLLSTVARTQSSPTSTLVVKTDIKREVRTKGPDGKEQVKYETFREAKKEDILVFTLTYTNGGNKDDQSGIMYTLQSDSAFINASGANTIIQVSVDGGKKWATHPAYFQITGPDGKTVQKPVPLDRITNVRWIFVQPVKPGQSGQVILRIRVK